VGGWSIDRSYALDVIFSLEPFRYNMVRHLTTCRVLTSRDSAVASTDRLAQGSVKRS
jgi:hypothetical protein